MLLVGDIGGTNTRIAIVDYKSELKIIKEHNFSTLEYPTLLLAIQAFLEGENYEFECISFCVAGPVKDGKCTVTAISWPVDIYEVADALKIPKAYLLNDLESNAFGIKILKEDEFYVLSEGEKNTSGNATIVSAGTGLGEAGLYWDGKKHRPFACEGSHTEFGPRNDLEIEFLKYLRKIYGHVSYERIVSGQGINNLYRFLIDEKIVPRNDTLEKELENHPEPQVLITQKGVKKEDKICERVMDWFASLYGTEAGNAALKFFAVGGVYLGGGIAPRVINVLKNGSFIKGFIDKGRFEKLMKTMPIKVILNDKTALLGAAQYAKLKITKVINGD